MRASEPPSERAAAPAAALPTSPATLLQRLDALAIATSTVHHPPVHTVEQAKALRGDLPGGHIKNLFLRNKKGAMWLVVALEDRQIDLKALDRALGAGRFSFGSADRLMAHLGVEPGSVTPFAVINDRAGKVQVVLDEGLFAYELVNCHPLVNDMTTAIAPDDLVRFLDAEGHPPQRLDLGGLA